MLHYWNVIQDSLAAVVGGNTPGPSALGDFWNLVEQAGPLRWPIFAVLAIGLVLVIGKLYELLKDRSLSRSLFELDLRSATLPAISAHVSKQRETMLASLQATMLNVFQTRPTDSMLHDEITNFVSFRQDQFGVFRRRMEFLSDTAGALGLMGTVWGMFQVFFQGTSDKDVILRGMGIALITTLLGLAVSIILNLSATELSTFFGKRLEQVSKKCDELRFRLLELAVANPAPLGPAVTHPQPVAQRQNPPKAQAKPPPRPGPQNRPVAEPEASGCYFEGETAEYVARAGELLRNVGLKVRRNDGRVATGVAVAISVPPGAGTLNGGQREVRQDTDAQGQIRFDWNVPEQAGAFSLKASIPGMPGAERRVDVRVEAGAPYRTECEGNNQAVAAGMRLPQPLGVRVYDRFRNPVPGVPVTFKVKSGGGRFGKGGTDVTLKTKADGVAETTFAVSSTPGPNVVVVEVKGQEDPLEFVAFGTEI